MKARRQSAILDVVEQEAVRSQEQLRQRLASRGFDVTQATLSRDIKELGLLKRSSDGAYQPAGAQIDVAGHRARRARPRAVGIPGQHRTGAAAGRAQDRAPGRRSCWGWRSIARDCRSRRHARRRRHHPDHRARCEERAGRWSKQAEGPRELKQDRRAGLFGRRAIDRRHVRGSRDRHRADVVTVTLDLGQSGDMAEIRDRAHRRRRGRARTCSTSARSSRATSCCRRSRPARCRTRAIRWRPR